MSMGNRFTAGSSGSEVVGAQGISPRKAGYSRAAGLALAVSMAASAVLGSGLGVAAADPLAEQPAQVEDAAESAGSERTVEPHYPDAPADTFYAADPVALERAAPGDVLATRPMPDLLFFPDTDISQILFASTNSQGEPIAATTTIMKPRSAAPGGPLLSYQHIINGLGTQCFVGEALYSDDPDNIVREAPGLNAVLQQGWTVALPDHLGPTMAYGAARLGGTITLDGIRAAQRADLGLESSPVGLAGYSGGGMATAWAAALAPEYAPDLDEVIVGAAQGGVPMDLGEMLDSLGTDPHPAFGLAMAAAMGLEREYPDQMPLSEQLNDEGLALREQIGNGCTNRIMLYGAGKSAAMIADGASNFMVDPQVRSVIDANSAALYEGVPLAPMFEWHSAADPLIPVVAIDETNQRYCEAGVELWKHDTYAPEHLTAAVEGLPAALSWLTERFEGKPAPSNC